MLARDDLSFCKIGNALLRRGIYLLYEGPGTCNSGPDLYLEVAVADVRQLNAADSRLMVLFRIVHGLLAQ